MLYLFRKMHIAVKGAAVASWKETMEMEYDPSYTAPMHSI
jgi:hypothetical protein